MEKNSSVKKTQVYAQKPRQKKAVQEFHLRIRHKEGTETISRILLRIISGAGKSNRDQLSWNNGPMRSNHHGSRLPIGKSGRERGEGGHHHTNPLAKAEGVQKRRRDRREETEGQ